MPDQRLDEKGRCCGRKPLVYKGGSWMSPPGSPMQVCLTCDAIYELDGTLRSAARWVKTSAELGAFWHLPKTTDTIGNGSVIETLCAVKGRVISMTNAPPARRRCYACLSHYRAEGGR